MNRSEFILKVNDALHGLDAADNVTAARRVAMLLFDALSSPEKPVLIDQECDKCGKESDLDFAYLCHDCYHEKPEKPDSLVGLECSRCDVKWVGENVGSAQGWARMSDNPWDWHCPECATAKPKVYTCPPEITTEMPNTALVAAYPANRTNTVQQTTVNPPVATDAERELFDLIDKISWSGECESVKSSAARVIEERTFERDGWIKRYEVVKAHAERAEARVKELEATAKGNDSFSMDTLRFIDADELRKLAERQRDAAVEGLRHITMMDEGQNEYARETLSQVEKMAGEDGSLAARTDAARRETPPSSSAPESRVPTGSIPDASPALSIPDAIAKARADLVCGWCWTDEQAAFLKALQDATDAELARLGKEVEKFKAWAGYLLKELRSARDSEDFDTSDCDRAEVDGIVPGEEPK